MIVFSWENQGFQSEDHLMQAAFWVVNVDFNPKNDVMVISHLNLDSGKKKNNKFQLPKKNNLVQLTYVICPTTRRSSQTARITMPGDIG